MAVSVRKYGMLRDASPVTSPARRLRVDVGLLSTSWMHQLLMVAFAAAMTVPPASAEQLSIADLVNELQPSVVNITITRNMKTQGTGGNIVTQDKIEEKKVQSSGFFINSSGVILTNRHVIADAGEIVVTLHDGSRLRASVVAEATSNDIALLKVSAGKPVPTAKFGDSDLLRPGDPVFLIGNPLGLGSTVTSGIVSAVDRNTPDSESASFIQIDAALNLGNSGVPFSTGTAKSLA
jgi:serine protease Do